MRNGKCSHLSRSETRADADAAKVLTMDEARRLQATLQSFQSSFAPERVSGRWNSNY